MCPKLLKLVQNDQNKPQINKIDNYALIISLIPEGFPISTEGWVLKETVLYKLYSNEKPEVMMDYNLGFEIGNINVGILEVEYNTSVLSDGPFELQLMMDLCFLYSMKQYYELHALNSMVTPEI
jgi:hypothetical protein